MKIYKRYTVLFKNGIEKVYNYEIDKDSNINRQEDLRYFVY